MKYNIEKIIELRKSGKITIKRFSEMLGVTTKTVYNWENGVTKLKKIDLLAIAQVYNINISEISDIKGFGFQYIKPGLFKSDPVHDSVKLLKSIIGEASCSDYAGLLPLLQSEEHIKLLSKENTRLLEANSRLMQILNFHDIPIYIKNVKRVITYINQAFLNLLTDSLKKSDIIGYKFSEIFSYKDSLSLIKLENEAFKGKNITGVPLKLPFSDSDKTYNITIKMLSVKNDKVTEIIGQVV